VYRRVVRYIPAKTARIVYRPLTPVQKSAKLQTDDSTTNMPEADEEIFLGEAMYASDFDVENEESEDSNSSDTSDSASDSESASDSVEDGEDDLEDVFEGIPVNGVFFPVTFGTPDGGSIAISNTFSSGKRGATLSKSTSFGGSVESTIIN
jgi:hypothetical protein